MSKIRKAIAETDDACEYCGEQIDAGKKIVLVKNHESDVEHVCCSAACAREISY